MAKATTTKRGITPERAAAGQRLRKKRLAAKIDPALMAHLISVDPKTIDNYETGFTGAPGAVEFAYDNIELLMSSRLGRRTSAWEHAYGSYALRLFDPDELPAVTDLRDHIVAQITQNDSIHLYANAS